MALLTNILSAYRVNASVYEDESGNAGSDGVNAGSPTTSTGTSGEDFLEYNGSSQSSEMAQTSIDVFSGDYTLAVRFRTSTALGTSNTIAGYGSTTDNNPAFIIRGGGAGIIQGWIRNDTTSVSATAISTTDANLYNDSERIAILSYDSTAESVSIEE